MKKFLFPLLMISMIISSCTTKVVEKPFVATALDSITIEDGAENPVRIRIRGAFGYDSTSIVNQFSQNEEEYANFVQSIFDILELQCNYKRTFVPKELLGFEMIDTIQYNGEIIYNFKILATGYAQNAYGVESEVSDVLDILAWQHVREYEPLEEGEPIERSVLWYMTPNDNKYSKGAWLNSIKEAIDMYK